MPVIAAPADVRALLARIRTIAVVGLSPDPSRDSHRVASYLADSGYRIIGVNPRYAAGDPDGRAEFRGEPVRASLSDIPDGDRRTVDLVDVFRRPEEALAVAREAARFRLPALWFQLGCDSPEGVAEADRAGLAVVSGSCTMVAHRLLKPGRPERPPAR